MMALDFYPLRKPNSEKVDCHTTEVREFQHVNVRFLSSEREAETASVAGGLKLKFPSVVLVQGFLEQVPGTQCGPCRLSLRYRIFTALMSKLDMTNSNVHDYIIILLILRILFLFQPRLPDKPKPKTEFTCFCLEQYM